MACLFGGTSKGLVVWSLMQVCFERCMGHEGRREDITLCKVRAEQLTTNLPTKLNDLLDPHVAPFRSSNLRPGAFIFNCPSNNAREILHGGERNLNVPVGLFFRNNGAEVYEIELRLKSLQVLGFVVRVSQIICKKAWLEESVFEDLLLSTFVSLVTYLEATMVIKDLPSYHG
jgi:hypothetical protein